MQADEQELIQRVERSLESKKLRDAIVACRELNLRFPGNFDGWRIAGDVHALAGKPEAVLFSTAKAEAIRPGDPAIALQRIEAHLGAGDLASARQLLLDIDDNVVAPAAIHDRLGRHMASLDLHDESLAQYQRALEIEPDNASLLFNLATAQRFLGQTDDAIRSLDRVLEIDQRDYEAQAMRSSLSAQSNASNHVDELESLLGDTEMTDVGRTSIHYALAKEYDDIDDPQSSFRNLRRGADLRRSTMDYRVETDIDILIELKRVYSESFFKDTTPGAESAEPIFIIGLPRTGTTLAERILGSHSSVMSAGELDNFGREMMRLLRESGGGHAVDAKSAVQRCSTLDHRKLGQRYIDSTRPITGTTSRFIDKLPFNYLYVGLIHRALPNARIIELVRHPMATGYAVYKQLFRDPYPFSYDLADLARYYVAYRSLMEHWHDVLPGVILPVSYEDLVNDTAKETRRLLDYCGLDWQDRCLRFYENEQAATTASAAQVRRPVYRSSLDRWQSYRSYLEPFENILNDAGINTRPYRR